MQMILATDGLNRLFGTRFGPVQLVRDAGLAAVQRLGPVRRFFIRRAMGLAADAPRLMRGEPL
jgi:2-octaprenyl-6-methoxyphenol hydroxylase